MKAADDRGPGIAQLPGEIVSFEDQVARALDGTEKRDDLLSQQIQVSKSKDIFRGSVFEKLIEGLRVLIVGLTNAEVCHHEPLAISGSFGFSKNYSVRNPILSRARTRSSRRDIFIF